VGIKTRDWDIQTIQPGICRSLRGVWFYSDNYKYLVDKTLHQQPVLSVQGHASYYFKNLMWVSINTTWFNGGKTLVDDVPQGDLLDNWRLGATWSVPIAKGQS
jgi:hypothetical protein